MIDEAIAVAQGSPCRKSRRGVVAFDDDAQILGRGYNGPPGVFRCDGSDACRRDCAKRCVHAEMRALRGLQSPHRNKLDLIHVEIDEQSRLCIATGGPSCWQCSREILETRMRGIWLYEAIDTWRWYSAEHFHRTTLENCGVHV